MLSGKALSRVRILGERTAHKAIDADSTTAAARASTIKFTCIFIGLEEIVEFKLMGRGSRRQRSKWWQMGMVRALKERRRTEGGKEEEMENTAAEMFTSKILIKKH